MKYSRIVIGTGAIGAALLLTAFGGVAPSGNASIAVSGAATVATVAEPASVSRDNATEKALDYLSFTAFSRTGLIKQLMYAGFSRADATYGTDAAHANWYKQAALKAKDYMDLTAFSRSGLIAQLKYEGFTTAQATYGAKAVGY